METLKVSETELKIIIPRNPREVIVTKDRQLEVIDGVKETITFWQARLEKEEAILADMEEKGIKTLEELQEQSPEE